MTEDARAIIDALNAIERAIQKLTVQIEDTNRRLDSISVVVVVGEITETLRQ